MTRYVSISPDRFRVRRWTRSQNYKFAASDTVVPIVGAEVGKAALSMPLTFVRKGDQFALSAVLSILPGLDMFVGPDGRWMFGYIPAFLRAYPFRLWKPDRASELLLCIDEDSGLISDDAAIGQSFFNENGEVSPQLSEVLKFLSELERNRAVTDLAVAALEQADLIVPWQIKVHTDRGEQSVDGLYKIDEAALDALPTEKFEKLRATGALPIAYGQLFSMNQLSVFKTLADLQAKMAPKPAAALPDTLDKLFDMGNTDVLKFD